MKKLDVVTTQRLANFVFPEDAKLALFNLSVDLMSGTMAYEVVDGPPDVIAEDNDIAVALGLTTVGAFGVRVDEVFDDDHASYQDILKTLVRKRRPGPQAKTSFSLPRPPHSVAAIVACEGPDGRMACAVFRHPHLTHDQALIVLADLLPQEAEAPNEN